MKRMQQVGICPDIASFFDRIRALEADSQPDIKQGQFQPHTKAQIVSRLGRNQWDAIVAASIRGGRLGGNMRGEIKEAFQLFIRTCGQVAGEEAGMENASAILYEIATSPGASKKHKQVEKVMQQSVAESKWLQIITWAAVIVDWYEEWQSKQQGRQSLQRQRSCSDFQLRLQADTSEIDAIIRAGEQQRNAFDAVVDDRRHGSTDPKQDACPAGDLSRLGTYAMYAKCEEHVASGGSHGLSPSDLAMSIVDLLKQSTDDMILQTRLFDLLGAQGFELLSWLLQHQTFLRHLSPSDLRHKPVLTPVPAVDGSRPTRTPTVGPTVTIKTEEQIRAERERRKEERRGKKQAQPGFASQSHIPNGHVPDELCLTASYTDPSQIDWMSILGFNPMHEDEDREEKALRPEGSKLVYDRARGLPSDAVKHYRPGYEEVYIPAPRHVSLGGRRLVPISELEPWAQSAFKGMTCFNRIQSEVFEAAFRTQENLLICAPTGAGKTNIAMLALLALIREHMQACGRIDTTSLKAIYIAPMKALAQEVVAKFSERLQGLHLIARELTGDMQLTKREVEESQLIVTTPEKWDVVTRKGGEGSLAEMVGLVIVDEVHLLADDRGAVIESIVARLQRQVETKQRAVRLIGLSATLPNHEDVGLFLRVNAKRGLFHFGPEYRPVPLEMTFMGVTEKQKLRQLMLMNALAYQKALQAVANGHQVMIFVHSRKDTTRTAQALRDKAAKENTMPQFSCVSTKAYQAHQSQVAKSRNNDLREHFQYGFGIHHAGMLRPDRTLTERMFADGALRVLVCTATLAWGINLPAHTVIIKGTEVYNPDRGGFTDLSMLDVMQIFGRAGRPQYDTSGEAHLITSHRSLSRYLALLTHQTPIESTFIKQLPDQLNAEIVSGTVTDIREGVAWLSYTYLYIRMLKNPMAYGITYEEAQKDPMLDLKRLQLITDAARTLDSDRMIRYDPRSGNLAVTDMGRTASHFYIRHESVEQFNGLLFDTLSEGQALHVLCSAKEFEEVKVRPEELDEIDKLRATACRFDTGTPVEESAGKSSVLLQSYISQARVTGFTLISDTNYVAQNAGRVGRALFEVCLRKGWCSLAETFLRICKSVDRRTWWFHSPLRQFDVLSNDVLRKLEEKRGNVDQVLDMTAAELGQLVHHTRSGRTILELARRLPRLDMSASIQPITRSILRVTLRIQAAFDWLDRFHGSVESWWIWIEDAENRRIYHSEYWVLQKKQKDEDHVIAFTIPIFEPLPPQYIVRAVSDRWVGAESSVTVSFRHLILPDRHPPHTDLLDLAPLPKTALQNPDFERLYSFTYFNPIQTQSFHVLHQTDSNVLVGAPTGSGKTLLAELAVLRLIKTQKGAKTVYIAPLKALARERLEEWKRKLGEGLGLTVLELSGDVTPDIALLKRADIIVTTPEKWDGITRNWKKRDYVGAVRLLIIDEIHLLGEDRGPVLEVIVSRMRYIGAQKGWQVRMLGLSTALANPRDLADWLGVGLEGLFNFRPSVRPIPMDVHVAGFPGRHYCPRMATMNKPCYQAIMEHSPEKPALIFVSSRRQTRLTALELITLCAQSDNPKQFLHMPEEEITDIAATIRDAALRHALVFGVGLHHAGLEDHDRITVENLFVSGRIQVLVCTSTLAWGVNFPARLVIIKGTEYYDGKVGRYVDFPVTDILQMMGRAGRPQYDTEGVACILVHESKKNFIKRFLYEPFPVESNLKEVLHNHVNAEVAGGAIQNKQHAVEYLTWTFFFRRLVMNPTYYHLEETDPESVQRYLLDLVDSTLNTLQVASCLEIQDNFLVRPTVSGHIASYYYLDYRSVQLIRDALQSSDFTGDVQACTALLAETHEYDELPVRHNEDMTNAHLAEEVAWPTTGWDMSSAHTKAFLLLQGHFQQLHMPITDYVNDTKSVLDQAPRILNALIDIAADEGLLPAALSGMQVSQMLVQGMSETDSSLIQLQCLARESRAIESLERHGLADLRSLARADVTRIRKALTNSSVDINRVLEEVSKLELVTLLTCQILDDTGHKEVGRVGEVPVLRADGDYQLIVSLACRPGRRLPCALGRVSRRVQDCSWWVFLGQEDELLALKRVRVGKGGLQKARRDREMQLTLNFAAPLDPGESELKVYCVPDSMLGVQNCTALRIIVSAEGESDAEQCPHGLAVHEKDVTRQAKS